MNTILSWVADELGILSAKSPTGETIRAQYERKTHGNLTHSSSKGILQDGRVLGVKRQAHGILHYEHRLEAEIFSVNHMFFGLI